MSGMRYSKKEVRNNLTISKKNEIMRAAKHICENPTCGHEAYEVHHVISVKHGGQNVEENLVALCSNCHTRFERNIEDSSILDDIINNRSADHKRRISAQFKDMKPPRRIFASGKSNDEKNVHDNTFSQENAQSIPDKKSVKSASNKTSGLNKNKAKVKDTVNINKNTHPHGLYYTILIPKEVQLYLNRLIEENKIYIDSNNQYRMQYNCELLPYYFFDDDSTEYEIFNCYEEEFLKIFDRIRRGLNKKKDLCVICHMPKFSKECLDLLLEQKRITLIKGEYALINNGKAKIHKHSKIDKNIPSNGKYHEILIPKEVELYLNKLIKENKVCINKNNEYITKHDERSLIPSVFFDLEAIKLCNQEILYCENKYQEIIDCIQSGITKKTAIYKEVGQRDFAAECLETLVDQGKLKIISKNYVVVN